MRKEQQNTLSLPQITINWILVERSLFESDPPLRFHSLFLWPPPSPSRQTHFLNGPLSWISGWSKKFSCYCLDHHRFKSVLINFWLISNWLNLKFGKLRKIFFHGVILVWHSENFWQYLWIFHDERLHCLPILCMISISIMESQDSYFFLGSSRMLTLLLVKHTDDGCKIKIASFALSTWSWLYPSK